MTNVLSNWQDSLDDGLVNRLTRPLCQPGMMRMAMSQRIINRCDGFLNRLPLLSQQMQRWGNTNTITSESIPIVYAQPASFAQEESMKNREYSVQPTVFQNQASANIIQRKLDFSQFLTTPTVNNTIPTPNRTDLSNFNFSDEIQSPTSKIQINQTSISSSSSENRVVVPEVTSQDLVKTEQMPLPVKFTDSKTSSFLNPNIPSQQISDGVTTINQTSLSSSSSENRVVVPEVTSQEVVKTEQMPLPVKFTDSKTSSFLNPNIPFQQISDGVTKINQTSISSLENPVNKPFPIIQAKLQNSFVSPSFPIVNHLNTLVSPKQTQQNKQHNNYPEDQDSTKQAKLVSQISSTNLPIVTAKNQNSSVNLTQEEISFSTTSPNPQKQPASILKTKPAHISNQINQSNNNISSLPLISVTSQISSSLKPHSLPLPLANSPSLRSSIRQPNLSNRNSIVSNTESSSPPPTILSSPLSTKATSSQEATQSNIDVDTIASQVERKLMRRLVIESERRGKIR
ncbi:hypothetical protein RIVM261_034500 [Rivularia sp. IAM M-261]|nr:hypothetical protein RIVM261_034500 [Rivularia sp. IAM M-261]